jgi:RNA polymerase sigma-70 factor (ECF subfamily)
MNDEPLQQLLDALNRGDPEAAERLCAAYGPALRSLVRRQLPRRLRRKLDSIDVVQSVWARLWPGFRDARWQFESAEQLRAFLLTVVRRRLVDQLRRHHAAMERERPLEPAVPAVVSAPQPRPSELAQAEEMWDRLLALCPPEHHDLLRLKRLGLPLGEIASRTGLHEGSVRRVLRHLARRLALDQEPLAPAEEDGP